MSKDEYPSKLPTSQTNIPITGTYPNEDRNLLLDKGRSPGLIRNIETTDQWDPYPRIERNSYCFSTYENRLEENNYDSNYLWEENKKLREDVCKMDTKIQKLSRDENVILKQLQQSEEDRYTLLGEISELRDECNKATTHLNTVLTQLRLTELKLESMTSEWELCKQQEHVNTTKAEMRAELKMRQKETDHERRVEDLLRSSQEVRLENTKLQGLLETRETEIEQLKEKIGLFSAVKESSLDDKICIQDNLSLYKELSSQMKVKLVGGEYQSSTQNDSEKFNFGFAKKKHRQIDSRTLQDMSGKAFRGVLLRSLVDISKNPVFWPFYICAIVSLLFLFTDCIFKKRNVADYDARVNAWLYLKEKYYVKN